MKAQTLDHVSDQLGRSYTSFLSVKREKLVKHSSSLRHPREIISNAATRLDRWGEQLKSTAPALTENPEKKIDHLGKMLEAYSFKKTLERGFSVIRTTDGTPVINAQQAGKHSNLEIEFQDNQYVSVKTTKNSTSTKKQKKTAPDKKNADTSQTSLF